MEIFSGRPEDVSGRQPREIRAYDFLDSLGVEYTRVDHAPANDMESCLEIDKALEVLICKNLFLCNRQKTNFYLLLMPGDKPFKTKDLSAQLGIARLSFADEAAMLELLDLEPGSVSVLGLINDKDKCVRLVIDRDVLDGEFIGCHPCRNTSSIKLSIRDLKEKILPALGHEPTVVTL